ncbi:MAG: hypothetical protein ACRDTC_12255 [Pseudonocardiaceae bacterium]
MINRGLSVHQLRHQHLCAVLRAALVEAVQAGRRAAEGIGTVSGRAVATLYLILMNHSVDQRGRCRFCRRPGGWRARRRWRCRVQREASAWLGQPTEFIRTQIGRELGLPVPDAAKLPSRPGVGLEVAPAPGYSRPGLRAHT